MVSIPSRFGLSFLERDVRVRELEEARGVGQRARGVLLRLARRVLPSVPEESGGGHARVLQIRRPRLVEADVVPAHLALGALPRDHHAVLHRGRGVVARPRRRGRRHRDPLHLPVRGPGCAYALAPITIRTLFLQQRAQGDPLVWNILC